MGRKYNERRVKGFDVFDWECECGAIFTCTTNEVFRINKTPCKFCGCSIDGIQSWSVKKEPGKIGLFIGKFISNRRNTVSGGRTSLWFRIKRSMKAKITYLFGQD